MTQQRKNIVLIGATGSIGKSTLEIIAAHPDRLRLLGIAAHRNATALDAIADRFNVPHKALYLDSGVEGLTRLATLDDADIVVMAAVGTVGLLPTLAAIVAGKNIVLASKEVLVLAGKCVMEAARKHNVRILPIDSEHNALFQCLEALHSPQHVKRLLLTASGGPFLRHTSEQMLQVRLADACRHPNWEMGTKVTIDSSTMANKGLEMIEARWLFDIPANRIDVVVHPQSIVHSMVECIDGSVIAQLCPTSMTFPIQHALFYPERQPHPLPGLDFTQMMNLSFEPPDLHRFPCLRLARQALLAEGSAPAVFNAANEVAVDAFCHDRIPYLSIPDIIESTLNQIENLNDDSLESVLDADFSARTLAQAQILRHLSK